MTITGDWYNELGSYMQFTADPFGGISGTYVSAKGHATGRYTLVGRYDTPSEEGFGTPIGWTVAWNNEQHDAGSVTCWNGLYTSEGGEQICATWLLTGSSPPDDVWESTAVGQDVFTREAPGADRIEEATAARAAEQVSAKHMGRRKPRAAAGRVRKGEEAPA